MDSPTPVGFWPRLRWWWRTRNWRTFAAGAPALVAALVGGAVAVAGWTTSDRDLQARYLTEGKAAFQAKDYPRAVTCYDRAVAAGADDPDARYRLALATEAAGDTARAATLMRGLAPDDKAGYAPAHYWWARKLLAAPPSPRVTAAAEAHLLRSLDGDPEDRPAAHGLLGQLYLAAGRADDAETHLAKAAPTRPIFRLPLARAHLARGNPTRARQEAELALRFFRDRAKADPTNHPARLAWADAATFLEDFPAAVAVLEDGRAASGADVYRLAQARVYLAWFETRKKSPGAPAGELIGLLDKGLSCDPANRDLLARLLDQTRVSGPDADRAREALRGLAAKGGPAVALVHVALAMDAHHRGDAAAEKLHLETAFALDPKTGVVANNLAWVLTQPPAPDLPRALALATTAVGREPDNPVFRDTRGRIHLALGDWRAALTDLAAAHARAPDTPGLHAALADVYEKLGQAALAAEHRRLAAAPPRK